MKKKCLNCKWLKLHDLHSGLCRRVKGVDAPRPVVQVSECCAEWQDAGQQYHIRMGWLKSQKRKE